MAKCKKYAEGGELPQDLTDRLAREANKADRDLILSPARAAGAAAKAVGNKIQEDLTGGAYVGSRLNMPSNTRLGKLSARDTRLLNKYDEKPYKAGGAVGSASKRADGCAVRGKTKGRML